MVTLAVLTPAELGELVGASEPGPTFSYGILLMVLAMVAATVYAVRARHTFHDTNPYLF